MNTRNSKPSIWPRLCGMGSSRRTTNHNLPGRKKRVRCVLWSKQSQRVTPTCCIVPGTEYAKIKLFPQIMTMTDKQWLNGRLRPATLRESSSLGRGGQGEVLTGFGSSWFLSKGHTGQIDTKDKCTLDKSKSSPNHSKHDDG